ncbi:MAG TPA: TonB family protein [Vicinamibacterales bacterium]|nr:TonB family protein [Vicinamibacterales bacterium]
MYFDFEDNRPDTPVMPRPMSRREAVMSTVIVHLLGIILVLIAPSLPFVQAMVEEQQQALEAERLRQLEQERERARFVFVQPRVDTPAPKPPPRADLSDLDRQARTVERPPNPTNPLPFSRGNTLERMEAEAPRPGRETPAPEPTPPVAEGESARSGLTLPNAPMAAEPRASEKSGENGDKGPAVGVIADAIRNVQRYAQDESFRNLQGGRDQDFAPSIQFDTKGVEFGPWLRRFVAQIRRNWFIPYAAMAMHGHVVVTFNVHRDGRITDVMVAKPSNVDAFTRSAQNAILASNPTVPLPPEYPDDRAFFTVTFYFNESPDR